MELQEIEDRLESLAKEIEDLEGKPDGYLFMEDLLRQQEKLFERVDRTLDQCSVNRSEFSSARSFCPAATVVPFIKAMVLMQCRTCPAVGSSKYRIK